MLKLFFLLLIAELFIGGGGRLFEVGSVTLRMLLFAAAMAVTVVPEFWRRGGRDLPLALGLVLLFLSVHLPAVLIGLARGDKIATVFGEIQPLLYWFMAPFLARMLSSIHNIELTADVVRLAGQAMGLAYLLLLTGLLLGYINFMSALTVLGGTGEFFFRGAQGLFVYKGFLYLCIGLLFLVALKSPAKWFSVTLVMCAILLTLTRGFILASVIATLLLLWTMGRRRTVGIVVLLGVLAAVVWIVGATFTQGGILQRSDADISNTVRLNDIRFMLNNVDPVTLIFGHGFGALISGSRLNIENSYLWIWWKAGLAGLLFWFTPLLLCVNAFRQIAANSRVFPMACAFFFSVVLIYLQTAMNPYLTNPIGLSFVIIAVFALRTLQRAQAADAQPLGSGAPARTAPGELAPA